MSNPACSWQYQVQQSQKSFCIVVPSGSVTFERRAISNFPKWHLSPCMLCDLHITSEGTIETEGAGMLQVSLNKARLFLPTRYCV